MARQFGRVSEFIAAKWIEQLRADTAYFSVHTADPFSVSDPRTTEPVGQGYARAAVTLTRVGRLLRPASQVVFFGLAPGTVLTHMSGWTTAFNGTMTAAWPIGTITYTDTETSGALIIPANAAFLGLDS